MLGLILVYPEVNAEGQAVAPDRDFLGAPVLARSLIAAIPAETDVQVVVAVAEKFTERVQADVIRRFGFIEVVKLLPWTGNLAAILTQSLEVFGSECSQIMLHDGRRPLLTQDHVKKLLRAADESGAAVSVLEHAGSQVVLDDEGHPHSSQQQTLQVLHPQALSVERLNSVLQNGDSFTGDSFTGDLNLLPMLENASVVALSADRDNLRIIDERDLSRAVEVWSRRAVEFPFLWPRPERFDAQQREIEAAPQAQSTAQEQVEADSGASEDDQDEDTSEDLMPGDSMNAMLSGDNAAESTPLVAAIANVDQDEEDKEEQDSGTSDVQE